MKYAAVAGSLLAACTVGSDQPDRPEPLPALPGPEPVATERFRDANTCGQCHLVDDTSPVLHDANGANVSPVLLWRSSLMALAARDPFYLAVVAEEIARNPADRAAIEATCTRCHAPAGSEELATSGSHLGFDELVSGTSTAAVLGREGVTCTLCHQIGERGLGEERSFTGGFDIGYSRLIYGPYSDPRTGPMQLIVDYTPTLGAHIGSSALCATCHTVIVQTAGGEVVEQATFLEWRSSSFAPDKPCQTCHTASVDASGAPITTPIASFPAGLPPRQPVGRHAFVGGNSYVLSLLADAVDWSGAGVSASELLASAARSEEHLHTAAELEIVDPHREGDAAVITVRVKNETGHKLPTGYPSRRLWLHITAHDGDRVVFESGAPGTLGEHPHRDVIDRDDQAQVWEAILVDAQGRPTHRALDARRYGKDNRILPLGFAPSTASDRARTLPVGTGGDASFVAGSDDVVYRMAGVPAGASITVELLYQVMRAELVDIIDASATPAATRFADLARARPVTPVMITQTTLTAP